MTQSTENVQVDQEKELIGSDQSTESNESYWTCYCKENPRDPGCKIYEI